MKKIIKLLFIGALLFTVSSAFAQSATVTIGSVNAKNGDTVTVPINVTNFSNVGAVSLKIKYDATKLNFIGTQNSAMPNPTVNSVNGVLAVGWYDNTGVTPLNISSGKLIDLKFIKSGPSTLIFDTPSNDIADETGTSLTGVGYNNGAVSAAQTTLTIKSVIASAGTIQVPITVANFSSIGAISLKISYDQNVLTFVSLLNIPVGMTASASGGVVSISWFDSKGNQPLSYSDGAALLKLVFTYSAGTSNLTFNTSASDIADSTGTSIINVNYVNGQVTGGESPSISFPDTIKVQTGNIVSIPITAKKFGDIGSVSLKVKYNPAVLVFYRAVNTISGVNFSSQASGGVLSLSWFDATGRNPIVSDSTVLVKLSFTAAQQSVSNIAFIDTLSEFTDSTAKVFAGVSYNGGTIVVKDSITGIAKIPGVVQNYNLAQNYPNPFNPSTTIEFSIPKESKVVLKVYNLLGQEVATLVNNELTTGSYRYYFDARNLSSGIYIYRLQAGTNTFTKKMTLLK